MPTLRAGFDEDDHLFITFGEIEMEHTNAVYIVRTTAEFEASLTEFFQKIINMRDSLSDETSPALPRGAEAKQYATAICDSIQNAVLDEPHIASIINAQLGQFINHVFPTLKEPDPC